MKSAIATLIICACASAASGSPVVDTLLPAYPTTSGFSGFIVGILDQGPTDVEQLQVSQTFRANSNVSDLDVAVSRQF